MTTVKEIRINGSEVSAIEWDGNYNEYSLMLNNEMAWRTCLDELKDGQCSIINVKDGSELGYMWVHGTMVTIQWADNKSEYVRYMSGYKRWCENGRNVMAAEMLDVFNAYARNNAPVTEEYIDEQVDKVILNNVTADYFKYDVEKVENGYKVYAWLENTIGGIYYLSDYGAVVRTRKEAEDWVISVGFDVQHYFNYIFAVEDSLRWEALSYGEQLVDAMFEGVEDMPNVADIPTISLGEDYSDFIAKRIVDEGSFCDDDFYTEDGIYVIAGNMDIEDYIFKSIAKRLNDYYPGYSFTVGDEWIEYKDVC